MLFLFTLAAFLAAALLFLVQPLMGKALLPHAGGSPSVWTTCMLFFQAALLAGYGLSHVVTQKLRPVAQVAAFGTLLVAAVLVSLRSAPLREAATAQPEARVLLSLAMSVGVPFVALSMVSPLLQRWFSTTGHRRARDPYFLSIASNAGSVFGLLAYPLAMERYLASSSQWQVWVGALVLAGVLLTCAGVAAIRRRSEHGDSPGTVQAEPPPSEPDAALTPGRRLHWLLLAMVPSSLMLGVTLHISTDIAAVPLLWALPLLLYLFSFMIAFAGPRFGTARLWGRVLPLVVLPLAATILLRARSPAIVLIVMHLLVLLVAATMCHRRMAELRPHPARLTEFYLFMSLGGVLGGLFSALIAPRVFSTVLEYPLMLAAACALRPQMSEDWKGVAKRAVLEVVMIASCVAIAWTAPRVADRWLPDGIAHHTMYHGLIAVGAPMLCLSLLLLAGGSARFAAALAAVLSIATYASPFGEVLARERTFFGVHLVTRQGAVHRLLHGTTLHGIQIRSDDPDLAPLRNVPGTYYHHSGPIGEIISELRMQGRFKRAGFVGLGAGTMAAYAQPGTHTTFFEIDPAVARFAQDAPLFSFVSDARARGAVVDIVLGDGRLSLANEPDGEFDLIAIDAFSSDAIPVHLITREAVAMFMSKCNGRGVLAFHVSNRSFDLPPVLFAIANDLGLKVAYRNDNIVSRTELTEGKATSDWVVLAREWEDLGPIAHSTLWQRPAPHANTPQDPLLWTDDRSDVLRVFTGW